MDNVNFKIYLVITWETITIHILPKISRCKGNQIMKFSQIIKYNTKKFLLKNHRQNGVEKLFPDLFLKGQNILTVS